MNVCLCKPTHVLYKLICLLPSQDGRTALSWAAEKGHVAILLRLIAAGADPSAADKVGCVIAGPASVFEIFLENDSLQIFLHFEL